LLQIHLGSGSVVLRHGRFQLLFKGLTSHRNYLLQDLEATARTHP
jgi:hypothetical protein